MALTRLPPPDRLTPQAAQRLIEVNFPDTRFLGSHGSAVLVARLAASGVTGGAVHALVAAAAAEHGLTLVSRDTGRPEPTERWAPIWSCWPDLARCVAPYRVASH